MSRWITRAEIGTAWINPPPWRPVLTPEDLAARLASYKPPAKPCMVCREHEQSVHVAGGGEVCDWCAMHIPVEMLPKGWPL